MDPINKEDVFAKVRQRIRNTPMDVIEDSIDRAEAYFCEGSGRRCVPPHAAFLWVDIAVAICKGELDGNQNTVSAIKRGDTTINYSADASSRLSGLDARIAKYRVAKQR